MSRTRFLVISALLMVAVALIAAADPFMSFVVQRYNPAGWGIFPLGAMVIFGSLCVFNAYRARRGKSPLTEPGETLAIFWVIVMGSWAAAWSFVETQMPILTAPPVFASAENGWNEFVIPYLPRWAMGPMDDPYALGYYNGLPAGVGIPWGRWIVPAAAWAGFAVAMALFCTGLGSVLSRQWIEHDRLSFPHAEIVLGMARDFLSNRLFWWGAGFAAAIPAWNLLQKVFPVFPPISLYFGGGAEGFEWMKGADRIVPQLNIMLIGLLYFVHRDILISGVVFFFAVALEKYGLDLAGAKLEHNDVFGWGAIYSWQTAGAILALVLFGLWSGRKSIIVFVRAGWNGTDDGRAWLSPRSSLVAMVLGFAGLAAWMVALGLRSPVPLITFLLSQGMGLLGMSRIAAESAMEINWPVDASAFALVMGGTAALAPAGFVALAIAQSWLTGGVWYGLFGYSMQGEKMRSQVRIPRGFMVTAIVGVALATVVAMYATAWTCYTRGANNFGTWAYQWHMRIPYDAATECARGMPVGTDLPRLGWLGAGLAAMMGLIWLRNHVVGWFLHPIGLVVGSLGKPGGAAGDTIVFTVIIAWIVKTLILRLGGVETYERMKPFFAGIAVGHFLPSAIGSLADAICFLNTGHPLT